MGIYPMIRSLNPATGEVLWEGAATPHEEIQKQIDEALKAQRAWRRLSFEDKSPYFNALTHVFKNRGQEISLSISKETGKPLWESKQEVEALIQKIELTLRAYQERCLLKEVPWKGGSLITCYRPHGVVAVLGPFNFPCHLPNGHIIPALISGNGVIFKPSELTPASGEMLVKCFHEAGFPPALLQIVQGGREQGEALIKHPGVRGVYFTGSLQTGLAINRALAGEPGKIVALEMGGNNPLIVSCITDINHALPIIRDSAFLTSGQRCTSARRLILSPFPKRNELVEKLIHEAEGLRIGAYDEQPEPYMGPVITQEAAQKLLGAQEQLEKKRAKVLLRMKRLHTSGSFVSPAILDVTDCQERPDDEYFGPLLQLIFTNSFEESISVAQSTKFGLSAGLISEQEEEWKIFSEEIEAGILNWNAPLTGASSQAPFGGIGFSGNHRPSGYFAVDYCNYPVASLRGANK